MDLRPAQVQAHRLQRVVRQDGFIRECEKGEMKRTEEGERQG